MDETQVSNLDKARENARMFADEMVMRVPLPVRQTKPRRNRRAA